jgi:hypothetical protein
MTWGAGGRICWVGVWVLVLSPLVGAQELPQPELTADEPAPAAEALDESDPAGRLVRILELADWDESRFSKFADGEPLSVDEQLEIWRLVQRLTSFDERWLAPRFAERVTPGELLENPARYRGRLVRITGQARHAEEQKPSPEDRKRFGLPHFHKTTVDVGGLPVEVTSADVPDRWEGLSPLDEPVEVAGVMIKVEVDPLGESRVHLAALRVAWHPTEARPPMVNHGMTVLGILGVDIGRFDDLVVGRELSSRDAPAFYQTLAAMGRSHAEQLQRAADRHRRQQHLALWETRLAEATAAGDQRQQTLARVVVQLAKEGKYSVAPFFNLPREQVGQIASFDGVVRSALRVEVEPSVAQEHEGLDHYFQLALFTEDSQHYPLFFCVRELPPGFPLGEGLNQPVRLSGFFLKTWRFTSGRPVADEGRKRSPADTMEAIVAPLFVGVAPQPIVPPTTNRSWGYAVALGVVLLMGGVWLLEWWRARRDRQFAATTLARVQRANQSLDFEELEMGATPSGEGKLP